MRAPAEGKSGRPAIPKTLTDRTAREAKPAAEGEYLISDQREPRLALRVGQKRKTWTVRATDKAGKRRREKLGTFPAMLLKEARSKAAEWIAATESGTLANPTATVAHLAQRFVTEHIADRLQLGRMRPTTAKEYERQIARYILPVLGKRQVATITRDDIMAVVGPLPGYQRNRVMGLLKQLFDRAEIWGMKSEATRNPCYRIDRAREEKRTRTLSPDEESALGTALASLEGTYPAAVAAIRFLSLTGLRVGDAVKTAANNGGMRWGNFDRTTGTVHLPDAKTGARTHGMDDVSRAFILSLPIRGEFVFSTNGAPLNDKHVRRVFGKALDLAGIEATPGNPRPRLHDLRRGVISYVAAQGAGVAVIQGVLGHADPSTAMGYAQRHDAAVADARADAASAKAAAFGIEAKAGELDVKRRA